MLGLSQSLLLKRHPLQLGSFFMATGAPLTIFNFCALVLDTLLLSFLLLKFVMKVQA